MVTFCTRFLVVMLNSSLVITRNKQLYEFEKRKWWNPFIPYKIDSGQKASLTDLELQKMQKRQHLEKRNFYSSNQAAASTSEQILRHCFH